MEIVKREISRNAIHIYTSSLGAAKALQRHKIESKLVSDCVEILTSISRHRHITIVWVPPFAGNECSTEARALAKEGASTTPFGPEPFLPITEGKCRRTCQKWTIERMQQKWRNTTDCAHTKGFISSPDTKFTKQLLQLSKQKVSIIAGLITGHIRLNKYLNVIGIRDDPDCDRCGEGAETAMHFLCKCPGYKILRKNIFNCEILNPSEAISTKIGRIFRFAKESGRFPILESYTITSHSLDRSSAGYTGTYAVLPSPQRPQQQTIG